jgi:hypothetical protein
MIACVSVCVFDPEAFRGPSLEKLGQSTRPRLVLTQ